MEITLATVDDAPRILELQHLAYETEATLYDDRTLPPLLETLAELVARFDDRKFLKVVAGQRIVGSVRAFQEATTCYLERLVVRPECRRQGLGTALLNGIEKHFPTVERYELFTGHKSESNLRLYQRLGYRTFRQERVNAKVTLVFMEKPAAKDHRL